jgi:hypothetical protein
MALDQEALSVVERRHRNHAQRAVRDEDQRLDSLGQQLRLEGAHQPVVELAGGSQVGARDPGERAAQLVGYLREPRLADRNSVSRDPRRQAHQQLGAVRQRDGIDHRGAPRDIIQPDRARSQLGDALVPVVVAQLRRLELLDGGSGAYQQRGRALGVDDQIRGSGENVHQVEVDRRHRPAKVMLRSPVARQRLLAGLLQEIHRALMGCDGRAGLPLGPEDPARLPVPAVDRLGRVRPLGVRQCTPGEIEGLVQSVLALVERTQVSEGVGQGAVVLHGAPQLDGIAQRGVRRQQAPGAELPGEMRQPAKAPGQVDQQSHLLAGVLQLPGELAGALRELERRRRAAGGEPRVGGIGERRHLGEERARVARAPGALAVGPECPIEGTTRGKEVAEIVAHPRRQLRLAALLRQPHGAVEQLFGSPRIADRQVRVSQASQDRSLAYPIAGAAGEGKRHLERFQRLVVAPQLLLRLGESAKRVDLPRGLTLRAEQARRFAPVSGGPLEAPASEELRSLALRCFRGPDRPGLQRRPTFAPRAWRRGDWSPAPRQW